VHSTGQVGLLAHASRAYFDDVTVWLNNPVGGFGEFPPLAGPAGTSGRGSATYAVLAGAAAGVVAFAVVATLSVKRRGVK